MVRLKAFGIFLDFGEGDIFPDSEEIILHKRKM